MLSRHIIAVSVVVAATVGVASAGPVVYVDANADQPADGLSWCSAYRTLAEALASAGAGTTIRVADGSYTPDPAGLSDPREATFQLINGVTIKGGYAGCGAANPNERNIATQETILSGDIGTAGNNADNCYHVVTGSGTTATAVLDGFTITAGNANDSTMPGYWGGGMYNSGGSPTVVDCTFKGNLALDSGAGMFNEESSSPKLVNCIFSGNASVNTGGAVGNLDSSPTLVNCTLSGNSAGTSGGGLDNYGSSPILTNCILWANTAPTGPQIYNQASSYPTVTYCCIQGWTSGGAGNTSTDPRFVGAGNLRLSAGSPCIDAGKNAAVPAGVTMDLDGRPRFLDDPETDDTGLGTGPIVDKGVYEYPGTDCNDNGIPDECDLSCGSPGGPCDVPGCGQSADCNANGFPDECEPGGIEDCNGNEIPDLCDIYIGTSNDCNSNSVPDECDIEAETSEDCNANSIPDECDIASGDSLDCNIDGIPDECEGLPEGNIYVDADATSGANNGSSWEDAYRQLSDALSFAQCSGTITRILVAAGTYRPATAGLSDPREATFQLSNGLAIEGGYAGYGAPDPDQRDIAAHETILSGDIGTAGNNTDNCYHVVTAGGTDATAVLDGFTVTAGNANGGYEYNGGGLLNQGGSPSISRCTVRNNSAVNAGGMFNSGLGAHPAVTNCAFIDNSAGLGSIAGIGGAVANANQSSPTMTNCLFSGNSVSGMWYGLGGAVYNDTCTPTLTNCTFAGNSAAGAFGGIGGGIYNQDSSPIITNCILWGDQASLDPEISNNGSSNPPVTYSCIAEGFPGVGNISSDPGFVGAGNLRLSAGSPCIDAGNNAAVPAGVLTDLDGHVRFSDDPATPDCRYEPGTCGAPPIVDMGAYELIPSIPGDFDHDGDVDGDDYAQFEACATGPAVAGPPPTGCTQAEFDAVDFDDDTDVDQSDFSVFQRCLSGEYGPADPGCAS